MVKIVLLQLMILLTSLLPPAMVQTARSGFKVREPNLYAPLLYADTLAFNATLLKLPGAENKQSYWELSYQLYFVPEDKYYEAIKRLPKGPSNPTPEDFAGRILLATGHKKRMHVNNVSQRTITLSRVPFKQKVPDAQRTKFAHLMTAYAVKIFDAQLNTTVYYSGIFLTQPYEESVEQSQAIARKTIYLNFSVTSDGTLNRSQLPPGVLH